MRKKVIITAAIAACLALCAVVWPQTEMLEDTMPSESPAVYAPKATVEELKTEVETVLSAEKEKAEITQPEQTQEPPWNRGLHLRKHPQLPKFSPHLIQHLSPEFLMFPLRVKLQNHPQLKQPLNLRLVT